VPQSAANQKRARPREWEFARHSADSVGAEQLSGLSHENLALSL
jgi:hypothetical protein